MDNIQPNSESADKTERPAVVAHHFDTAQQQFDSAKLGMWIFLVTEILFFGGVFCFYAVYRANNPGVFVDGHHFLETPLGALNTVVLIFSSLTMALAVRSAQLDRQKALKWFLSITLACAFVFLAVKAVEYKHKWDHRLVPGQARIQYWLSGQFVSDLFSRDGAIAPPKEFRPDEEYVKHKLEHAGYENLNEEQLSRHADNLRTFVGVYFALTGLHALHVIIGIGVIGWILVRAAKGQFHSRYFVPVDLTGLYWHLVDMIWIFLFPLLYLIH